MIDIHAIARHYGGEVSGGQALIPAIGHSARDRGVAVRAADDAPDGCLVHCFNGGDPLAEKDRLRADNFLPPLQAPGDRIPWSPPQRDTTPPPDHAVGLGPGQKIVATFEFLAADGALLYRKHRIEPGPDGRSKSFQYDRPNGKGGWVRGAGDDRVPYRLPDLLAAPRDLPILMVEGEAKADRLAGWGFLATSHKDWKGFEFSGYVKGRTVFILPDNDEAGEKQAQSTVEAVERAEGSPVLLRLPGLPDGGDILDWSGSTEDLRKLLEGAARTKVEPFPTLDLIALSKQSARPKRFVIERLAPEGEVTLFTGPGSSGKSLLSQQLATAAAIGKSTLGFNIEPTPSIYLTCEDDAEQLHWRQEHLCSALGTDMAALAGRLHLASVRGEIGSELATFAPDGSMKPTKAYDRLVATLTATGARLAFVDNVAHLFAGNENDRGEVTRFVGLLNRLAGETGAGIILLGHPNKSGDTYSGSTAWLNAVRSQFTVSHDEESDARTLTIGKANYARKGDQVRFFWQDWAFVLEDELPPDRAREFIEGQRASADNEIFLTCLREMTRQRRAVSEKSSKTFAPLVFAGMPEAKGIGKPRLEKAMDRLFRLDRIERAELWKGPDRKWVVGLRETAEIGAGNVAGDTCGDCG
ncbi:MULTISPECIES: AAA family ATPase [unclassified Citromicrobium]|uniref:AAA family ATPase n=1 Tax=unclassified Citromicrobium TaxID=2630544 RepID=UPI0009E89825|nr:MULTISPECIES: AAA family ATPase [unclassified Citromicrobium]